MKNKLYIAGVWGEGNRNAVSGLKNDEQVVYLEQDFPNYEKLRKVYRFVNTHGIGIGKRFLYFLLETPLFDKHYALSKCKFDQDEKNIVLIFNSALMHYYSCGYLKKLKKKKPNICLILYIIDPMPDGLWDRIEKMIKCFDMVLTIHPYNCKRYGFQYFPFIYTAPKLNKISNTMDSDLYYCGVMNPYRQKKINDIIFQCRKNHISYSFVLSKTNEEIRVEDENVVYSKISYEKNAENISRSNCILEVMHEGYVGITQRYLEAVVLNKKLLTNNPEIKELPYYNEAYMQYFENIEDIDWGWVKQKSVVDYQYRGEFAPEKWKKELFKRVKDWLH